MMNYVFVARVFPHCVTYISLRFSIVIGLDINLYNVAHDVRMEPQVSYIWQAKQH